MAGAPPAKAKSGSPRARPSGSGSEPGDAVEIGGRPLTVGGIIADEPDRLGEGFSFGAVAIVRDTLPAAAGLLSPGAMFRTKVRVALPPGRSPAAVVARPEAALRRIGLHASAPATTPRPAPSGSSRGWANSSCWSGWPRWRSPGSASAAACPPISRRGAASIATLKVLGASSGDIARIYLLQIVAAALVGSIAGLAAGVLVTPLLGQALAGLLPVTPGFVFDLGVAGAGCRLWRCWSRWCLPRRRCCARGAFPAMALMRARVTPLPCRLARAAAAGRRWGWRRSSASRWRAPRSRAYHCAFLAGAAGLLALLGALGWAIRHFAARCAAPGRSAAADRARQPPPPRRADRRAGDGARLRAVGLRAAGGDADQPRRQHRARVPARAPDYFVLDVPRDRLAEFERAVRAEMPARRDPQRADAARRDPRLWSRRADDPGRRPQGDSRTAPGRCAASAG